MLAIIVFLSLALLINSIFMLCVIIYGAHMKEENEKLKRELRFDRSVEALLSDLSKK
jgi:hypothetical protein|nr:MAG TPA: hypothetical protein [Caudoviricetes sp.]